MGIADRQSEPSSLAALAISPPTVPPQTVARHLENAYGLAGELELLVSERDQNYRLSTATGDDYVVKIASLAEDPAVTQCQIDALAHLHARQCAVAVPRVIPSRDGAAQTQIDDGSQSYRLRVVTWLHGALLEQSKVDAALASALGESLALIDSSLADFEFDSQGADLIWNMQRAADLVPLTRHIKGDGLRRDVEQCLDDFVSRVDPAIVALRQQPIHNDLNPGNVLVSIEQPRTVAGVIDFGDMTCAPTIVDVAVAIAYLRDAEEPLTLHAAFVAGFHRVLPLTALEIDLLYDMLRVRLATTVTILNWRASKSDANDEYLQKSLAERSAEHFLRRVNQVSRADYAAAIRSALHR